MYRIVYCKFKKNLNKCENKNYVNNTCINDYNLKDTMSQCR